MRVISTKVHGMLDYPLGIVLILFPNIFSLTDDSGAAIWVPRIIGILILATSLMTKYEFGVVKVISMVNHLRLDYVMSLLLAVSPWLFGFHDEGANAWLIIFCLHKKKTAPKEPFFRCFGPLLVAAAAIAATTTK
jgi:hypothetical protein